MHHDPLNHHPHHNGQKPAWKPMPWKLSFWVVGFGSLIWLLLRSGLNPRRLAYPCQRAAAANSLAFLAYLGSVFGVTAIFRRLKTRLAYRVVALAAALLMLATLPGLVWGPATRASAASKQLVGWSSGSAIANVFAVSNVPVPLYSLNGGVIPAGVSASAALHDDGVDQMVNLMEANGDYFYKTAAHPDGLFAAQDVVVIKVSNQWDGRNGTNSDVLKGVIYRLTQHPEGFNGAVIVAENTQGANTDWYNQASGDNSQFQNQSYQEVVQAFAGLGYRTCISSWDTFRSTFVSDYDAGSSANGYVLEDIDSSSLEAGHGRLSYPKFQVNCNGVSLSVSMKKGLWNGSSFDNSRLKMINLPVLKRHNSAWATSAVKNYIGFLTTADNGSRWINPGYVHCWLLGTVDNGSTCTAYTDDLGLLALQLARVRRADLNIVDAIWVNPRDNAGWHGEARRQDTLMASRDPFAVDYYASEYVLYPLVKLYGGTSTPEHSRITFQGGWFRRWMAVNAAVMRQEGVMDTILIDDSLTREQELAQMNVFVANGGETVLTPTPTGTQMLPTPTGTATQPAPTSSPTPVPATPTRTPVSPTGTVTAPTSTPSQVPPTATSTAAPTATQPPGGVVTREFSLAASADDASEDGSLFSGTNTTMFLGSGSSPSTSWGGMRFSAVDIPAGAQIQSAQVQVMSSSSQWVNLSYDLYAEASGNCQGFTSSSRPSSRTLTAARVSHRSDTSWSANTWYTLDAVTALVQETVNRGDWQPGNSLCIIMDGTGSAWGRKTVNTFDRGAASAPRLLVTYQTGSPAASPTPAFTATVLPPTTTFTPTVTAIPPTATRTPTVQPTYTRTPTALPPTATPTRTPTSVPPTATYTPTATSVPPTATYTPTATSVLPTATPTRTPTSLPPSPTPTASQVPGSVITRTYPVNLTADDASEDGNNFSSANTTMFLGTGASASTSWGGMRFSGVDIPSGAQIQSAVVQVMSSSGQWLTVQYDLYAEASDSCQSFSAASKPSARARTSARVSHRSNLQWTASTWYNLDPVTALVQETVNRAGWQSGNSLCLIMDGTGSAWGRKNIYTLDRGAANAPRLVITYSMP